MENYKITPQRQLDAILDYISRVYAREIVNTNLLIDVLEKTGIDREAIVGQVNHDLEDLNNQIRDSIFVEFGYLDLNNLSNSH